MTPQGAERKAVAADLAYRKNLFFIEDLKQQYVKAKFIGIDKNDWFCFEDIKTGNIYGRPTLRAVYLAKTDDK